MVSTFIKLKNASKNYDSDYKLESACRISKNYVKTGFLIGIFTLFLSFFTLITTLVIIFKSF